MTQEDKDLLLKDLCARLPYGIKASYYGSEEERETWDEIESITFDGYVDIGQYSLPIERIKPYLFPLSSMTEEEFDKLKEYGKLEYDNLDLVSFHNGTYKMLDFYLNGVPSGAVIRVFDWLNKNHFDYRGLIESGLAIDATGLNIY